MFNYSYSVKGRKFICAVLSLRILTGLLQVLLQFLLVLLLWSLFCLPLGFSAFGFHLGF